MDPEFPTFYQSFYYAIWEGGPLALFGWMSFCCIIVLGGIFICQAPRNDHRVSVPDVFAACIHVEMLIFMLCVQLVLTSGYSREIGQGIGSLLLNFFTCLGLLGLVSLRHRVRPNIEWLPVISVMTAMLAIFAIWSFKISIASI